MDPVTWNFVIRILLVLAIVFFLIWVHILIEIFKSHGVPDVQTRSELIDELASHLRLDEKSVFVDLWCGSGEVVYQLQKHFPSSSFHGIESRIYPVWKARKRNSENGVHIHKQNFFTTDLSWMTHIYCYLMPHLMTRVRKKIAWECASWTMVYVNAFPVEWVEPLTKIDLWKQKSFSRCVYVYQV